MKKKENVHSIQDKKRDRILNMYQHNRSDFCYLVLRDVRASPLYVRLAHAWRSIDRSRGLYKLGWDVRVGQSILAVSLLVIAWGMIW